MVGLSLRYRHINFEQAIKNNIKNSSLLKITFFIDQNRTVPSPVRSMGEG
jgi:hypothetical protein